MWQTQFYDTDVFLFSRTVLMNRWTTLAWHFYPLDLTSTGITLCEKYSKRNISLYRMWPLGCVMMSVQQLCRKIYMLTYQKILVLTAPAVLYRMKYCVLRSSVRPWWTGILQLVVSPQLQVQWLLAPGGQTVVILIWLVMSPWQSFSNKSLCQTEDVLSMWSLTFCDLIKRDNKCSDFDILFLGVVCFSFLIKSNTCGKKTPLKTM